MSDDNVCAWHGCNRRIDKGHGVKIGPHSYHWQCIKELVDGDHIPMYCDDIESYPRDSRKMIQAANAAPAKMTKYPKPGR